MFPPPGRFLSSIGGLGWLALLALACGGEEVSLDPSPSAAIIEDTKPLQDPNEPQNNEPMYTGPPTTPRPCPECFAQPFPKPSPGPPCPQRTLTANADPDYAAIEEPSTEGWLEYVSPNHAFGFKYPPDWELRVFIIDEYGWAGEDGILDGQRISGFPSETFTLWNPASLSKLGPPEAAPQTDLAPLPGLGKIDMDYGPSGPFRGSWSCEPGLTGNPNEVSITVAGLPGKAMISTSEPPDSDPTQYFFALEVDPSEFAVLHMAGYSWGDASNLAVAKGLASTIRFDAR